MKNKTYLFNSRRSRSASPTLILPLLRAVKFPVRSDKPRLSMKPDWLSSVDFGGIVDRLRADSVFISMSPVNVVMSISGILPSVLAPMVPTIGRRATIPDPAG